LDSCVVSDFGVGAHSDGVVETIDDCSETDVSVLGEGDVAINCSIGCDLSGAGDGETVVFDVEYISMAIDWL